MHTIRYIIALMLVTFFLTACSSSSTVSAPTQLPVATQTLGPIDLRNPQPGAMVAQLPTRTATRLPSPQPSATPSQIPTRTATPSPTPTEPASKRYQSAFGIDYGQPEKYLTQGEQTRLSDPSVMGVLRQRKPGWAQVAEIFPWLRHEFKASATGGTQIGVSTTEQLIKDRQMTGCHDWALVYASFARALGYPTVIVDTAGIPWIKQFQSGQKGGYSGHVFIEVFVEGKWVLIDSTNGWYVKDGYDPTNPIIPLKAGFSGETNDLYGFYVMRKGVDTWGYGIHSNAELTKLMEETARQVKLEALVNPKYEFGRFQ